MKNKLFVFMIDALCEFDVSYMRTLPNFGSILERGALVEEMLPVYPSFTYPCHVSIMTGCYPDRHGIPHNEMVKAGIELPVKMVITPHNESWPFGRLIEEVSREHALFMEMERLKKLTDRAHRRLEQQEEQTLREAARQAKDLLARMRLQDDRQPNHEQLSGAADRLQQLLDKM